MDGESNQICTLKMGDYNKVTDIKIIFLFSINFRIFANFKD